MRLLKIIAWIVIGTLPMWIVFAICLAYAGLATAIIMWLMSYGAAEIAMLIFAPIAFTGFIVVCAGWGGVIRDNARLQAWCERQANRVIPTTELPLYSR